MNKNTLITLTGLDASGKSTQIKLIKKYFESHGKKVKNLHFPMYGHNEFSDLIAKFLKGEFGDINDINPIFIANIYAMDRYLYKEQLELDLKENDIVLLDRYVDCNVSFQCAKVQDDIKREELKKWIYDFEYGFLGLHKPDLTLFLDVPINTIEERLNVVRVGEDRDYLDGGKDIHEQDIDFQNRVRTNYLEMDNENYFIIKTYNEQGIVLSPEDIFKKYINLL